MVRSVLFSLSLLVLLGVFAPLEGQQRAPKSFKLPASSCPRADSLLGSTMDEPQYLRAEGIPDQDTIHVYAGETPRTLEASLTASRRGPIDEPDAKFYIVLTDDAKRTFFASADAPRFVLVIDDSLIDLGPAHTGVPLSPRAPLGFDVWVSPLVLSKVVRANTVQARLGGVALKTGETFQRSLRAGYRVALCGASPTGR
jgi:hypothetical protein